MSKELPPELRPHLVPQDSATMLAECLVDLREAVAGNEPWFTAHLRSDGLVKMFGYSNLEGSAALALSAIEAWAMAAEQEGDGRPRAILRAVQQITGASSSYHSGGVVPARR